MRLIGLHLSTIYAGPCCQGYSTAGAFSRDQQTNDIEEPEDLLDAFVPVEFAIVARTNTNNGDLVKRR
eukprot:scaffold329352_cov18-Prasinocladus_malaysianus.AAC.1